MTEFTKYGYFSMIFSLAAHLGLFLLKPFPFLLRDLKPKVQVRPEERFILDQSSPGIAIVTGSNTGLGFETASSLVELGYHVILACRNTEKGEKAAIKINSRLQETKVKGGTLGEGKAVFLHPLDLSSLESVRSFVGVFTSKFDHLNILVNNAGIAEGGKSVDGYDLVFHANFLGHYLLTRMLLPQLLGAVNTFPSRDGGIANNGKEAGRVVNLSSVTHHFASANLERTNDGEGGSRSGVHDEEWWRGCTIPGVSLNTYAESKLAALMFTQGLNERFGKKGLRAVSANPGSVYSDIWRDAPSWEQKLYRKILLTTKQGSTASLASAVGDLPKDAVYVQPYWQPWGKRKIAADSNSSFRNWYSMPIQPATEMGGVYVGFAVTDCRLPKYTGSSIALWNICEEIVGLKEKIL